MTAHRSRLPLILAIVFALVVVPPATAKSPPSKKYECVIGSTLFGTLRIKSSTAYTHRGKAGKYSAGATRVTFKDGRKGYRLTFRTGSLKGMKGRWYKTSDGLYEIAIRNPADDFESIYCDS
jgi:hypothetical protein